MYQLVDRESRTWVLGNYQTYEEAYADMLKTEELDILNNEYVEDCYEIIDREG